MINGDVEVTPEEQADLVPGTNLAGYQIVQLLGRGARATVYLARSLAMDELVAVKVLKVPGEKETKRFQRQGRICARLVHRNIVRMNALGIHDGILYCVMEYVEGETLQSILKRGVLSTDQFVSMFVQVAEAIGYAHDHQVLHRDIKPANLMVAKASASGSTLVKVVDFGLAALFETDESIPVDPESTTTPGTMKGSPAYMSPEQCRSEKLDARSDIYSLGCTMYESLVGRVPFKANTVYEVMMKQIHEPATIPPDVRISPLLQKLVLRCLAKKPEDRNQSITELRCELAAMDLDSSMTLTGGSGTNSTRKLGPVVVILVALPVVLLALAYKTHMTGLQKGPPNSKSDKVIFESNSRFRLDKMKYYQGLSPNRLLELSYRKAASDPDQLLLRRMVCEVAGRRGQLRLLIDAQSGIVEHLRKTEEAGGQKDVEELEHSLSKTEATEVPKVVRARAYYQIYEYYFAYGRLNEACRNCEAAISLTENSSNVLELQQYFRASETLGRCYAQMGDQPRAIRCFGKILQLCEDKLIRNRCNLLIASSAILIDDRKAYDAALGRLVRPLNDETVTALELSRLGCNLLDTKHFKEGKQIILEASDMFERCSSNWYEDRAAALVKLALYSLNEREIVQAERYCKQALELAHRADSPRAAKLIKDVERLQTRISIRLKKIAPLYSSKQDNG